MVLTRATVSPGADGIFGDNPLTPVNEAADDVRPVNTTTPFVDQNQTYTSHPSHQVFLREYSGDGGAAVSTGRLLDSTTNGGGLATWADVKAQALDKLGIRLSDHDITNVPLLKTDQYGKFERSSGYAVMVSGSAASPQLLPGTAAGTATTTDDVFTKGVLEGTAATRSLRTGHAFLDDIAHTAAPYT